MMKIHPTKFIDIYDELDIKIDCFQQMWELAWCFDDITKNNVLIGFSSTALITPKLLFNKEPIVICLYKL